MDEKEFSGKLIELLRTSTEILCEWLSDALPKLDQAWWSSRVLSQLSYQQRERVDRQGIHSLQQLDLYAPIQISNFLKKNLLSLDFRFSRAKLRAMFMGKIQIKNKVSKNQTK